MAFSHTLRKKNYYSQVNALGIKKLNKILHFDKKNQFIIVEPGMTMEMLIDATLPHGLVPAVVPEFKGITVGGAISGAAIESRSHRYGQFNDICLSYEILTGEGKVVTASPEENRDLFYAFSGSYGSLGSLLSVKIALVSQGPWMHLIYKKFSSFEEALDFMSHLNQEVMEAIIFPEKTVVIYGFSIENPGPLGTTRMRYYFDDWFYAHVDRLPNGYEEAIATKDYLFRHDRGAFWMAGYSLHPRMLFSYLTKWIKPKFCLPKNPGKLFRFLFGGLTSSKKLYKSLHSDNENWFKQYFVIQDFYLPKEGAKKFIAHILDRYRITPLWICPVQATRWPQLLSPHWNEKESLLFDVGVYGIPDQASAEIAVKNLEQLTYQWGGKKMFYCSTYLSKMQFWQLYSEESYQEIRRKYGFEKTPDITERVLARE